jgi:hypothetical protein
MPCRSIPLANVNTNNQGGIAPDSSVNIYANGGLADEARIWKHNPKTGELTGWWVNEDKTYAIVSYAYDAATKSIVIVGDIASYLGVNPGSYQVVGRRDPLSRAICLILVFRGSISLTRSLPEC